MINLVQGLLFGPLMAGALVPIHSQLNCSSGCPGPVVRNGFFDRKNDGARIRRYRCRSCRRSFSDAGYSVCYRHKRRDLNTKVFAELTSGVSQRRMAEKLKADRKTIVRKFLFIGRIAIRLLPLLTGSETKVKVLEFDDLETFEHSKCKPLSVTLAVEYKTRRILGFRVSEMPAKGKLAKIALKKYGPRKDGRAEARDSLFRELRHCLDKDAVIKSDQNPHYGPDVKRHFGNCKHDTFKGRRGCVVGQGELKRGGYDPLFSLNHTCAMLRANINRLFRRTWCTTKKRKRLGYHIALYALYHNLVAIH